MGNDDEDKTSEGVWARLHHQRSLAREVLRSLPPPAVEGLLAVTANDRPPNNHEVWGLIALFAEVGMLWLSEEDERMGHAVHVPRPAVGRNDAAS